MNTPAAASALTVLLLSWGCSPSVRIEHAKPASNQPASVDIEFRRIGSKIYAASTGWIEHSASPVQDIQLRWDDAPLQTKRSQSEEWKGSWRADSSVWSATSPQDGKPHTLSVQTDQDTFKIPVPPDASKVTVEVDAIPVGFFKRMSYRICDLRYGCMVCCTILGTPTR